MTQPVTDDQKYGRQALRLGEPWIVPAALEHLAQLVQPDWQVFEWGCGGSTAWFSRQCAHVIGVEHNSEWVKRTGDILARLSCPNNWMILHVQGEGKDHRTAFRRYANVILTYPDEHFDLISVDGEASSRGWCITNGLAKLKPGGYLLLDNSDWFKRDLGWQRWDYVARELTWIGQPGTFDWHTSILRKPQ